MATVTDEVLLSAGQDGGADRFHTRMTAVQLPYLFQVKMLAYYKGLQSGQIAPLPGEWG